MIAEEIKSSPNGNFKLYQLCKNVVICQSATDPHGWGNATEDEPAFMVYRPPAKVLFRYLIIA